MTIRRSTWLLLLLAVLAFSAVLSLTRTAHAEEVIHIYGGVNGVWFDGVSPKPDDFELGANASASLSPHISAVGAGYFGVAHSYLRGSVGARFTASNVDDPNFSVGLGGQYHFSSEPGIRPEGFAPDASIGWVPWPEQLPNVSVTALASYNLAADQASLTVGGRLLFGGAK